MRRGELYRVRRPPGDPKPARVFVVVSRQPLIDSSVLDGDLRSSIYAVAWPAHPGVGEHRRRP